MTVSCAPGSTKHRTCALLTNIDVKECAETGDCFTASLVMTPNGDNFNDDLKLVYR